MSPLPFIATAISSIIDCPVKTYDECVAEGLDPNKTLDLDIVHKYSLPKINANGEFVRRPTFKQYEEHISKNGYDVEIDELAKSDAETDEPIEHVQIPDNNMQPLPTQPIRIFAYYHRNYTLNITTNDTVLRLKQKIQSKLNIDMNKISLSFS
ncbi:16532_t:CDS:2, partial [Gigaspora rosea]